MSVKSIFVGNLALFIVYAGAIAGGIFWCIPLLIILPFSPKWYMKASSVIVGSWMCFAVTWIQAVCGVTIRVYGDDLMQNDRQTLILLNHRTRLDYLYFWAYLFDRNMIYQHKIVLKEELNLVPAAGTAMQSACFIFLRRNWQQDHHALDRYLHFYDTAKHDTKLVIFPEGTDLRPDSVESSNRYAAKHGLPPYYYVLHPRTTGFVYLVQSMRARGRLDAVADVTVGYAANVPRAEEDLLAGRWPRVVDFFIDYYDVDKLPTSEEELSKWLVNKWGVKERFLNWYYTDLHKSDDSQERKLVDENCLVRNSETGKEYRLIFRTNLSLRNVFVTAVMTFFGLVVVFLCYSNIYVLAYTLIVAVLSVPLTLRFGGWDKVMINYNWQLTAQSKID